MYSANEIRKQFIEYYKNAHKHTYVPSSSTIPTNDSTLLFTNAGMNQFKSLFLGTVDPNSEFGKLKRVCNSQKCIRAGGKHNDLDDVGKDVYHHTFFEMLGNWSFGDYFKEEAIKQAWVLLTEVWKLPKERLYVTYFQGNEFIPADNDAKQFWLSIGVPAEHVLPFGSKENFWEMGDVGPCGPCTEIHFDRIGGRNAAHLVNKDDPDVLEIWNLVFIQYNREQNGELKLLPSKHVDTGMGFERIVSVLQNKSSNYDTDVFEPFFKAIQQLGVVRPYAGKIGKEDTDSIDMAYRVVSDHIRTLTVAITDGGQPENTGRGYVLRRILRRAIRYSNEKLGFKPGSLSQLVDVVVDNLGEFFPEIKKSSHRAKEIINQEEVQFLKTLNRGKKLFFTSVSHTIDKMISGKTAWKLNDTYGFPVDLTVLMAEEIGYKVNLAEFEEEKLKAQEIAKASDNFKASSSKLSIHELKYLQDKSIPITDSSAKYLYKYNESMKKYEFNELQCTLLAIYDENCNSYVDECSNTDHKYYFFFDKTNFYSEEGGQVYDKGYVVSNTDEMSEFNVETVHNYAGFVAHYGSITSSFKVGSQLKCHVDLVRRTSIMSNHTSTHLLNFALRKVVPETNQRGSLVTFDYLRFDFSTNVSLTQDNLKFIESTVQQMIDQDLPVFTSSVSLESSKLVDGIRAVFDETYPDPVRVVSIGIEDKQFIDQAIGYNYSIELCGGTHVSNTKHISSFVLISEDSISKGTRRIIAVTGSEAQNANEIAKNLESKISCFIENLKHLNSLCDMMEKFKFIDSLYADFIQFIKEWEVSVISCWKKAEIKTQIDEIKKSLELHLKTKETHIFNEALEYVKSSHSDENKFILSTIHKPLNAKMLDLLCKKFPSIPVLFISLDGDKCFFYSTVPKELQQKISAFDWVSKITEVLGGKHGGKQAMAQGTAIYNNKMNAAIENAQNYIKNNIQ